MCSFKVNDIAEAINYLCVISPDTNEPHRILSLERVGPFVQRGRKPDMLTQTIDSHR